MKKRIDNFSKQSSLYKKYRPHYPQELYHYLLSKVAHTNKCWDCGTGNGQVAAELAKYFDEVDATDISQNQIRNAIQKDNIKYSITRAEQTTFEDNQFDLITAAQAVHWFDIKAFNKEVKRVAKNKGLIAIWGYGLLTTDHEADALIREFYYEKVYDYWDAERKFIDENYRTVQFDFNNIEDKEFTMKVAWTLEHLTGYLNSWSSVQNYMETNNGNNPVKSLYNQLKKIWPEDLTKVMKFPIFMKVGEIVK